MRRSIIAGLACAVMIASPALAAPFVTVDGTRQYMAMLDEGSVVRSAGAVDAEVLMVMFRGPALLTKFHFDCTGRTAQKFGSRVVGDDASISGLRLNTEPPAAVQAGSLGDSLFERACFGRQINASGGWSRPTLREALVDARAILVRANSQP